MTWRHVRQYWCWMFGGPCPEQWIERDRAVAQAIRAANEAFIRRIVNEELDSHRRDEHGEKLDRGSHQE